MGRKVFLSFLGTTNYSAEKYYINSDPATALEPMRFVQEATLRHHCQDFTEKDAAYIFLTSEARNKNWEDFEHDNFKTKEKELKTGLKNVLKAMNLPFRVEDKQIVDGKREAEIWEIFQQVYDCLELNDEVYFDITHGFRSSPMLTMVLINYAKVLKAIEVKGIYYGAFEAGDRKQQLTPIWDLASFSHLQAWTAAANVFVEYGDAKALFQITERELQTASKEEKEVAIGIKQFIKYLQKVTESLKTNRGRDLVEGTMFKNLNENLSKLTDDNFIVPLKPLLKKVSEKVAHFSPSEDYKNGFKAVEWCIEHGLVQQGITMLQESIFTYYCVQANLDYKSKNDRELISDCFYILNRSIENDEGKWKNTTKERKPEVQRILPLILKEVASEYDSLTKAARNDINHGGFSDSPKKPEKLNDKLQDSYKNFCELLDLTENSKEG